MYLLSELDFSLPLTNPVIIFSLVLFIILFAPILFNRIKIPYIIGLIVAGVLIGPYGLNLLKRDSSIVLFGTVGLLYIMFFAGLEIDLTEFKKNKFKIIIFGLITFILPLAVGSFACYYILHFPLMSSLLLASMFSTHTLVSYPIASRFGVIKNKAVTLTVGGTMITDILALLILAAIAGLSREEVSSAFWVTLGLSSFIFVGIVFFLFPVVIRWFFKQFDDAVAQYIFVLAIVLLSSFLAEAAGLEAIIGAFFSGLVLNRFIPHSSPLMNRIDFVGNALFIPFFLISVGMLVDVSVLVKGWGALKVAAVIVTVAVITKYAAAKLTQKVFRLSKDEGMLMFGLSTSHAAATLAIILVGYNIIIGETASGEPIRLLNEDVLNGTILLILISCAISSFVVEKAARQLALSEETKETETSDVSERILISLAYPESVNDLVDIGLMLKPHSSSIPVYALNVVTDDRENGTSTSESKKMMEKAIKHAAATEQKVIPLIRHDISKSNGIVYTLKEQNITDLIIGLHHQANQDDFLGPVAERILKSTSETVFIYKSVQPLNTVKRMVVVVTKNAELEPGFPHWFRKLAIISRESGVALEFFATGDTIQELKEQQSLLKAESKMLYHHFSNWDDFLIFTREVKKNDLLVIVSSRKGHISYHGHLEKLPYYLSTYFSANSFIMLYPQQLERGYQGHDLRSVDGSLAETVSEKVVSVGRVSGFFKRLLKKKK